MASNIPPGINPTAGNAGVPQSGTPGSTPDPLLHPDQNPVAPVSPGQVPPVVDSEAKYRELQKAFTEETQKRALLEKTLEYMAPMFQQPTPGTTPATGTPGAQTAEDIEAKNFVRNIIQEELVPVRTTVNKSALAEIHPELKDPAFRAALVEYEKTLPAVIRAADNTVEGASYIISQFKALKGAVPPLPNPSPLVMEPGGAKANENAANGPIYSRRAIDHLRRFNPEEYRRRNDEILNAMAEGRVRD